MWGRTEGNTENTKVIRVEKRLWHSAQIVRLSMILMDLARFEVLAVAYEKISQ